MQLHLNQDRSKREKPQSNVNFPLGGTLASFTYMLSLTHIYLMIAKGWATMYIMNIIITVEMESLLGTPEEMLWGLYHKDNVTSCHMRSFEDSEYLSAIQRFLFGLESSARAWTEQALAAMHLVFIRLESAIINMLFTYKTIFHGVDTYVSKAYPETDYFMIIILFKVSEPTGTFPRLVKYKDWNLMGYLSCP